MKFERTRARRDAEERILPLINVVFLLLIFFMLAGRLAASDPFEVEPAHSASEGLAGTPEMLVLVGADGRLALDGEILPEAALEAAVAARVAEIESAGTAPRLRLKADASAEAVRVVAAMELLRAAGIARLNLLTVPEPSR